MSASLLCDICRTPKDSTTHYSLTRQERERDEPTRRWRRHGLDRCALHPLAQPAASMTILD